jgi:hypothetical protein
MAIKPTYIVVARRSPTSRRSLLPEGKSPCAANSLQPQFLKPLPKGPTVKQIAIVALILGLAGTVLGVVALTDKEEAFKKTTFTLKGGKDVLAEFDAPLVKSNHPKGTKGWSANQRVTGDRTGEYPRTCIPIVPDDIECNGAFLLNDGELEVEATDEGREAISKSEVPIIGGTEAYAGATGTVDVDFENDIYTFHVLTPEK